MSDFQKEFGVDLDLEGFDFGFSSVSEAEVIASKKQQKQVEEKVTVTAQATLGLDKKLDQLLALATKKNTEELEKEKSDLYVLYEKRMKVIEKLTLPLLYNLKKSSDDAYIHWPNREKMLDEQIRKILDVTRPKKNEL
tara:strand:+ start:2459 stop:2872 length:414 start_codon:yes stop_codon:yes gene_type:complete